MFSDSRWLAPSVFALVLLSSPAFAGNGDTGWSATFYGGPWTQHVVSDIVSKGDYKVEGALVGLDVDRRIFRLGWGFDFGAEGQVTQNFDGPSFTTFALGIGLRWNMPTDLPMSVAVYSGPSYAINPPIEDYYHTDRKQHKFLNYVGMEFALAVPFDPKHWDVVARIDHRSGVWGVYSDNADEGTVVGVGIRARF
jgi:hypothetical protein